MTFCVYIMTNKPQGTLYVGYTDDLARRVWEHRTAAVPGFTQKHGLTKLVYYEAFDTREAAKQRERRLKSWLRRWKIEAIDQMNPHWRDLYEEIANQ
ncbi:GIY-YIG nuclease family protein [Pyruvatibacter sp. HU-CL02332]|uniref:GIY-YIG nuclease family protein n=1 Tax=Pyruvatibacter sp. HU-CL02332 TaxID=3127650 RepID=UPI0031089E3F